MSDESLDIDDTKNAGSSSDENGSVETYSGEYEQEYSEYEQDADPLDKLSDAELVNLLENSVFMDFLKNYSPSALEGLEQMLNYAISISTKQIPSSGAVVPENIASDTESTVDSVKSKRNFRIESIPSINNLVEGRGPKINISTKTDMIVKAIEETQQNLDIYIKKSLRTKRNLRSELQEYGIRENDITESRNSFEFNIVTHGVDPLTQRIPAEKWIRFMEEWLKSSALIMEKLRLRTASLRIQYKKVSAVLIQRQELGKNVHAVDFDQLEIDNNHLQEKIEQNQIHLLEMKKMNGGANLVLTKHKKYLLRQQMDFNKLQRDIEQKEKQIEELDEEYVKVEAEKEVAKEKFMRFKDFKDKYRVPDVMEYVVLKKEVDELRKNIKILQRRKNIQDISLNASIRQMKNLTGSAVVDPSWLEDPPPEIEDEWL
ncbi:coiled-coil domain-containing protein 113 [Diorhabda sublineata]|uniref:coiled-coil domain-containing protein 113 n=1 Tax=Diorhabda sublineata TaxID=1163346 RepID=UPI0024E0BB12|nr:coiled-coil domain-containing protein 113 [Diorhabda sublineata]